MKPYTASVHGQEVVVDARLMRRGPVHLQQGDAGRASFGIRAFRLVLWVAFRLLFRVRVVGRAHLPRHPAIICFNPASAWMTSGWADGALAFNARSKAKLRSVSSFSTITHTWPPPLAPIVFTSG